MRIDIATLFPEMCETVLSESILGRGRERGAFSVYCHNIRDFTLDKHRRVDDEPYGGGRGMVMKADPIYRCYNAVREQLDAQPYRIYLSPKGTVFTQQHAKTLATKQNLFLLCGHYEGVDQRVIDSIIDEEISIGDYVLTGGEMPALVLVDAVVRMLPGVLAENVCFEEESHYNGLLEYPQYTRPSVWEGKEVPDVLLSGHHQHIDQWRFQQSLAITQRQRPDLYQEYFTNK